MVLVTGASGQEGKHLLRALSAKGMKLVPGFTVNETKKLCLQKVQLKFISEI